MLGVLPLVAVVASSSIVVSNFTDIGTDIVFLHVAAEFIEAKKWDYDEDREEPPVG